LSGEGGQLHFYDGSGALILPDEGAPPAVSQLPVVRSPSHKLDVVSREFADPAITYNIDEELYQASALPLDRFEEFLLAMHAQAPDYHDWCVTAVTSIIPVGPSTTAMISGSQGAWPGQVYLTGNLGPAKTAEMLIHEASHQYFAALQWICLLVQPGTDEHFYSPVVGRPRPVPKLLLAYHAFANVLLYMQRIAERAEAQERRFVESNLAKVGEDLAGLAGGIDSSTSLTEEGVWLWHHMKEKVLAA
jgi:HEXXH motif-containing protein